ncbi:MAG: prenyltransferase/squalene oxidase repeat-containing protein [Rhodopirellula sp. JB044]|uniref:prenyltransferase/squalene oxidase repeat-containing protein n=1 Tax=Rhodopirellula sp. JB044 TaxID=3342844 RepID=UPI00370C75E3
MQASPPPPPKTIPPPQRGAATARSVVAASPKRNAASKRIAASKQNTAPNRNAMRPLVVSTPPPKQNKEVQPLARKSPVAVMMHVAKGVQAKLLDAPEWMVSLVFHVVVLLILALLTTSPETVGRIVITMQQGDVDGNLDADLTEFDLDPVEMPDAEIDDDFEDTQLSEQVFDLDTSIDLASLSPSMNAMAMDVAKILDASGASGKIDEPRNMFAGRSGPMKQRLLRASGGTKETEEAVKLGLEWLRRNQLKNGSWSLSGPYAHGARAENQVSATAMAMLAFMGAGSTHRGGKYKTVLWKAVRWLVKQQDRQGFMAARSGEHEKMYSQAQAMIALCELYAMTGDSWIRPYAQSACDFACEAQSREGGWRYRPRFDSDTSVTGWFLVGLKSGEAAGLDVDRYVFPKVDGYLDTVQEKGASDYYPGGYAYRIGEAASPSMTAEGILCRQYLGWNRNTPGMRSGLTALQQNHPINPRERDVYYWYYATQALHHFGGPVWKKWNDTLKVELPASQERRGAERGSWSPARDAWGIYAGRLYTTCFSLYCLEVYYRHMPIYTPEEIMATDELDDV